MPVLAPKVPSDPRLRKASEFEQLLLRLPPVVADALQSLTAFDPTGLANPLAGLTRADLALRRTGTGLRAPRSKVGYQLGTDEGPAQGLMKFLRDFAKKQGTGLQVNPTKGAVVDVMEPRSRIDVFPRTIKGGSTSWPFKKGAAVDPSLQGATHEAGHMRGGYLNPTVTDLKLINQWEHDVFGTSHSKMVQDFGRDLRKELYEAFASRREGIPSVSPATAVESLGSRSDWYFLEEMIAEARSWDSVKKILGEEKAKKIYDPVSVAYYASTWSPKLSESLKKMEFQTVFSAQRRSGARSRPK